MSRAEKAKRVSEAVAGRLKRQSDKSPALPTNSVKTAPASTSNSWSCNVCSLKMSINSKPSHLAGMRHQKALDKLARQSGTSVPSALVSTPIPSGWWECDQCNRAPMKASSKDAHTKSKAHLAAATKGAVLKTRRWYVCVPCDKPVLQQQRLSHEAGHGAPTRRNYLDRDPEDPDSDSPGYSDTDDIKGWESDNESEIAGLLHDIDTAFGLLPHGGAYKESRHYYGPSKYDYY